MQKVLLLALLCLAVVFAQKANKKLWWNDTKATLLKSGNFLNHVGKDKIVIVQFIAQFSRDCQALLPEWDKLAVMYQGENAKRSDVTVALIDGWTFNSISQSYGVTAFPSIIIFGKGDAQTQTVYSGEKKADKMSEFIEQFANGQIAPTKEAGDNANADTQAPTDNNAQVPPQEPQQQQAPQDQVAQPTDNAQAPPQDAPQAPPTQPTDNAQAPPQDTPQPPPTQQSTPQQAAPQQAAPQQAAPQQAAAQPAEPREVNVVLNTSLLQTQFEELQRHNTALNEALQKSINDNFQKFESLRGLLDTHKNDLNVIGNNVLSHIQKFDEVKQSLQTQKNDIHKSVTEHTQQQVEELKNAVNQIKNKVFERRIEEPKESGFASSTVMFLVGGLIGAAVTFVIVSAQGNKNKRKLLID